MEAVFLLLFWRRLYFSGKFRKSSKFWEFFLTKTSKNCRQNLEKKECNWCVFHRKPNFHKISPNFGKFPEKNQFFWKFGSHLGSSTRNCEKTLFFNSSLISLIAFKICFQSLLYKSWDRKEWTRKEFGNSLTLVYKCQNPCGVNLLHIFCRQKKIRTQKSSLYWRYLRKKSSPGIRVTDKERVKDV